MGIRKSQFKLKPNEWAELIDAIDKIHQNGVSVPTYQDFVQIHIQAMDMNNPIGLTWGVHTMQGMHGMPGSDGRNFLSWHREYLAKLEQRLQKIHPNVTIPYWDWSVNRHIPKKLSDPNDLARWNVKRYGPSGKLPSLSAIKKVKQQKTFNDFQTLMEYTIHGTVHNFVGGGGDMSQNNSPNDPIFWLHHANIDRLWNEWQNAHSGMNPSNMNEKLQPSPIIARKVSEVQHISDLGYSYA
ncbi:MAG: tyrosinase family protein [Thaumarchaeota archaeon]|nr:tyrosinase family protein [Nitrososphaerota archaeon]